ncbi:MAG: VOC family protein [Blastocatellia bacterium]
MSKIGTIGWIDLTVENADSVKDFYAAVTGWQPAGLDMGGYDDYVMNTPESGEGISGICHARGSNVGLPPVWLIYINVADIEQSLAKCVELGGTAITPIKNYGGQGRYCIIRDPAGAHCALFEATT